MRKTIAAAAAIAVAGALFLTGCSSEPEPKENAAASDAPTVAEDYEATPAPEPVDPDEAYIDAMSADAQFGTRLLGSIDEASAFLAAGTIEDGSSTARTLSGTYDWLAKRIDAAPESLDSPAAQQNIAAFRICRDAYGDTADALDASDIPALDAAQSPQPGRMHPRTGGHQQQPAMIH